MKEYAKTEVSQPRAFPYRHVLLSRWLKRAALLIICTCLLISPSWISSYADMFTSKGPLSYDPTTLPRTAFFMISAALLGIISCAEWLINPSRTYSNTQQSARRLWLIWISLAALVLWMGISSLASPLRLASIMGSYTRYNGVIPHLMYLVMLMSISRLSFNKQQIYLCICSLLLGSIPVVALGFIQALGLDPFGWVASFGGRVGSSFGNPNMLGSYLIICICIAWANVRLHIHNTTLTSTLSLILLVPLLSLVLMSYNRSTLIALVCALVLFELLSRRFPHPLMYSANAREASLLTKIWRPHYKLPLMLSLAAVLLVSLGLDYAIRQQSSMLARLIDLFSTDYLSHSSRRAIWGLALEAISHKPFLGYGADVLDSVFSRYFDLKLASAYQQPAIIVDSPHNIFLQHALNGGLPELGLYLLFLGILSAALIKRRAWALFACLIGNLIQLSAVPTTASNESYLFMLMALALCIPPASFFGQEQMHVKQNANTTSKPHHSKGVLALPVTCITLLASSSLIYIALTLQVADYHYAQSKSSKPDAPLLAEKACIQAPYIIQYHVQNLRAIKGSIFMSESDKLDMLIKQGDQSQRLLPHANLITVAYLDSLLSLTEQSPIKKDKILKKAQVLAEQLKEDAPTFPRATYLRALERYLAGDETSAQSLAQESFVQASEVHPEAEKLLARMGLSPQRTE